jgi:hypothetical protein
LKWWDDVIVSPDKWARAFVLQRLIVSGVYGTYRLSNCGLGHSPDRWLTALLNHVLFFVYGLQNAPAEL